MKQALSSTITVIKPSRGWVPLKLRDLWEYRELKPIQLLMTAEEILIQSFRAIRERHITLMSVFLRKNLMEHMALQ